MSTIQAFLLDESGTTMVGYGVISCVVSIPVTAARAVAAGSYSELLLTVAELVAGAAPR
jgi:Flp pilus assembly pilin Flp